MKLKKPIKYYFEYLSLIIFVYIIRLFPLRISLLFAKKLGILLFYLNKKHRKRAIDNLRNALGENNNKELLKILKNVYVNLTKVFMEFLNLPLLNEKYFKKNIRIVGKENLDEALKLKKGIIAISGHIGNWELSGAILVKMGYHLDVIYHPLRNPLSDRFINRIREKAGIKLIPFKKAFRLSLKSLHQNHILALIADQDVGGAGIFIDFFNRPASTAKGPAFFAIKTKAPLIFITLIRETNDRHTLYISKPLDVYITNNLKEDIYYNTKLWSEELEKYVRRYPEQWFWLHRRWHTKPK